MSRDEALPRDHYFRLVRQWSNFGPPLRPWPGDTAVVQRTIGGLGTGARAVILGLTPETVGCVWPEDARLLALDHSETMVRALWTPARRPPHSQAILADWRSVPVSSATVDLVAGDACHNLLAYPAGFEALTREVHRILRPGGRFVIRVFLRPDRTESLADIARALEAGGIGSVHALKLRLLAAVHEMSGAGSRLNDVWQAWRTLAPPPSIRNAAIGWTDGELEGIESYRGQETRYHLPTLAEFRGGVAPWFVEIECARSSHELSERCPTFVLAHDRP